MKHELAKNLYLSIILAACLFVFLPAVYAQEDAIVSLRETGRAFAQIAKEVSPAVVNVQSDQTAVSLDGSDDGEDHGLTEEDIPAPFLDLFKNLDPGMAPFQIRRQPIVRQGSGFIITADGYIVTNNHLIEKASKITVKLLDNKEYIAKVIGADPQSDIAVLKIDAKDLPIVKLGNSDDVEVGEWVVALGNPFGLSHSLSAGILSAKGRSSIGIADYENFLQTDAAINPGNSGGPLLDLDGQVIGINTAIFSRSGGYMGIGFAIPMNMAKIIIDQLIASGTVVRGYLGVRIQELSKDLAASFGTTASKGILVAQLEKDSPADKAGLKQGDIITDLDGKVVENPGEFRNTIAGSKPGSMHTLAIIRDNKAMQLQAKVGSLEADPSSKETKVDDQQTISKIGLTIQNLTADIAGKLGYKGDGGVVISKVKPGSIADLSGLSRGMIIIEVNRKKVNNAKQFMAEVNKGLQTKSINLLTQDQYGSRYIVIKLN